MGASLYSWWHIFPQYFSPVLVAIVITLLSKRLFLNEFQRRRSIFIGIVGVVIAIARLSLYTPRSSTSGLAILAIPSYGSLGYCLGYACAYVVSVGANVLKKKQPVLSLSSIIAGVLLILLLWIGGSEGYRVYVLYGAKNPSSSPEKLTKIYNTKLTHTWASGEAIRKALANNPQTPPEILKGLAQSKNVYLLRDIGMNPNTPVDLLVDIANSTKDYTVLWGVARNPKTPASILTMLANRSERDWPSPQDFLVWNLYQVYVFSGIATNPNTPIEVLQKMARSGNETAKAGADFALLIRDEKTSCDTLKSYMLHHGNKAIADLAKGEFDRRCP